MALCVPFWLRERIQIARRGPDNVTVYWICFMGRQREEEGKKIEKRGKDKAKCGDEGITGMPQRDRFVKVYECMIGCQSLSLPLSLFLHLAYCQTTLFPSKHISWISCATMRKCEINCLQLSVCMCFYALPDLVIFFLRGNDIMKLFSPNCCQV